MSWRLAVEHVTEYEYAGDVFASYNEARITPRATTASSCSTIASTSHPRRPLLQYIDYWGSEVCAFSVHERHRALVGDRPLPRGDAVGRWISRSRTRVWLA